LKLLDLHRGLRLGQLLSGADSVIASFLRQRVEIRALRYTVTESGADLALSGKFIDSGKVKPVVTKTYQLKQAATAQQFLEREHPPGKVVLLVP
jgi:NADPH:quinone reductase-like Zn-dependent oxidoreductase